MRFGVSKFFLTIFIIFFAIVVLHYVHVLSPVENLTMKVLGPIGSGFYNFSQKIVSFSKSEASSADYEKLLVERNQLVAENADLKILERENDELRAAINFLKEKSYNSLAANVIGRDPNSSNYFILNKGLKDGVKDNFPVVSPEGILVGKILKAEDNLSVMLIPTDTNFQTAASILGKTKGSTSGLVQGEKGLGIKMQFIPQDEDVSVRDIVVTSGLELNMPKGLVIGRISEVTKESRSIFSEAIISPLVIYENLDLVLILPPKI
jgi:rod shape-determining protein MreC